MKKLGSFLFSMFFTGILLVIFAIAIGYATFVENDYGTITAKILIYNSRWFEILLFILSINLIGSIFHYITCQQEEMVCCIVSHRICCNTDWCIGNTLLWLRGNDAYQRKQFC